MWIRAVDFGGRETERKRERIERARKLSIVRGRKPSSHFKPSFRTLSRLHHLYLPSNEIASIVQALCEKEGERESESVLLLRAAAVATPS